MRSYRVRWQSQFTGESGETVVPGHMTRAELRPLSPETVYRVSVVATYQHKDSEPLNGLETTDGKDHWEHWEHGEHWEHWGQWEDWELLGTIRTLGILGVLVHWEHFSTHPTQVRCLCVTVTAERHLR